MDNQVGILIRSGDHDYGIDERNQQASVDRPSGSEINGLKIQDPKRSTNHQHTAKLNMESSREHHQMTSRSIPVDPLSNESTILFSSVSRTS